MLSLPKIKANCTPSSPQPGSLNVGTIAKSRLNSAFRRPSLSSGVPVYRADRHVPHTDIAQLRPVELNPPHATPGNLGSKPPEGVPAGSDLVPALSGSLTINHSSPPFFSFRTIDGTSVFFPWIVAIFSSASASVSRSDPLEAAYSSPPPPLLRALMAAMPSPSCLPLTSWPGAAPLPCLTLEPLSTS